MRRTTTSLLAALLVAALALTGCGGTDDAGHGGHDEAAGVGATADPADAARTIEVTTLDAMLFDPPTIEVAAGETVTFVVTNTGEAVHEFVLGDAATQEEHAEEMEGSDHGVAHDDPNGITVPPGETAELTWRFGEAGTVEYACHLPGHYEAGMRGSVTVG